MYAEATSLGRRLGSVARRYQQPTCRRPWPPEPARPNGRILGRDPGQVAPVRRQGERPPELANLEAVLFLAKEPLGSRKLAQLASLADGTKARTLVRELNRRYDEERRAFRVVEVAGGFQLLTRPKFAPWLRRSHGSQVEVRLSAPAMETLAVVAYRQPVLRADIEAVRGVQCGEILRQLMERDLVRIVGRSEDLGRPFLYGTTKQFLQVFGLRHLDELPRPELLRSTKPDATGERTSEPDTNPDQNNLSNQPILSNQTGGESNVKTAATLEFVTQDGFRRSASTVTEDDTDRVLNYAPDEEDDEDFEDDEDLDDEDEDLDDDEEDEWEEVDDEDEDLDYEDEEEDEDEEWEDEEDEEWEDEDEDEDWDDEEEEEEEEEDWE